MHYAQADQFKLLQSSNSPRQLPPHLQVPGIREIQGRERNQRLDSISMTSFKAESLNNFLVGGRNNLSRQVSARDIMQDIRQSMSSGDQNSMRPSQHSSGNIEPHQQQPMGNF